MQKTTRPGHWRWSVMLCIVHVVFSLTAGLPGAGAFSRGAGEASPAGKRAGAWILAGKGARAHVNYYTKVHGVADPDVYPLVRTAHEIFKRVRAVADKRGNRLPKLQIIRGDGAPWAAALPDGFIVLSTSALDVCHGNVSRMEGDARLAFVLGHELAHMAQDDFWHMEVYMAMSGDPAGEELRAILEQASDAPGADLEKRLAASRAKEMKADDLGFVYAAIAGFQVDMLLEKTGEQGGFFNEWVRRAHHSPRMFEPSGHPPPGQRAGMLRSRLKTLRGSLEFFKFGVRLAHFGRYEDAVYFFREFLKVYPSREVFNNLGCCHLRMALKEMPVHIAYEYWLPTVVDVRSRSESIVRTKGEPSAGRTPESARLFLEEARELFKRACESDPLYAPGRINQAITHFHLGEIYKARAAVEEAAKLTPENVDVEILRAIIISREFPVGDTGAVAIRMLQEVCAREDAPLSAFYNLAVLLEQRGRTGAAGEIRRRHGEKFKALPEPYRSIFSRGSYVETPSGQNPGPSNRNLPWKLPVALGTDFLENPGALDALAGWDAIGFDWHVAALAGNIYRSNAGEAVLELDGVVEMVVLEGGSLGAGEALPDGWEPVEEETVVNGALLTYQGAPRWAALLREGRVREIWVVP